MIYCRLTRKNRPDQSQSLFPEKVKKQIAQLRLGNLFFMHGQIPKLRCRKKVSLKVKCFN